MAWKKVVQITAVSACPKCGNAGFDLEPGEDIDDLNALIRCGQCGYVCPAGEFMRPVRPKARQQTARIYQTVERPDGSGKRVLSDWSAYSDIRLDNLVLLDPAGFFVWAAQLPDGTSPESLKMNAPFAGIRKKRRNGFNGRSFSSSISFQALTASSA